MSKKNFVILIVLGTTLLASWGVFSSGYIVDYLDRQGAIKAADQLFENGLYAKSLDQYKAVLEDKERDNIRAKYIEAFGRAYDDGEVSYQKYSEALNEAISLHPGYAEYTEKLASLYCDKSKYEDAYNCLKSAIDRGTVTEQIENIFYEVKYSYIVRGTEIRNYQISSDESITIEKNDKWGRYNSDATLDESAEYRYLGPSSGGIQVVVTEDSSRVKDGSGVSQGIFENEIEKAYAYSDSFIPVFIDGKLWYSTVSADLVYGPYEEGSCFFNGYAAVRDSDEWKILESSDGENVRSYEDVIIDERGFFNAYGKFIAKDKGVYVLCDEEFNVLYELSRENVDEYRGDWIAYQENGLWGYVSSTGKCMVEPIYEEAKSFSNGLAAVKIDGKWGFIDKDQRLVIPASFSEAGYFNSQGVCIVSVMNEKGPDEEMDHAEAEKSYQFLKLRLGIR